MSPIFFLLLAAIASSGVAALYAPTDCFIDIRLSPGDPGYGHLVFPFANGLTTFWGFHCKDVYLWVDRGAFVCPTDNATVCGEPIAVDSRAVEACMKPVFAIGARLPECTVDARATPDFCGYGDVLFPNVASALQQSACLSIYVRYRLGENSDIN